MVQIGFLASGNRIFLLWNSKHNYPCHICHKKTRNTESKNSPSPILPTRESQFSKCKPQTFILKHQLKTSKEEPPSLPPELETISLSENVKAQWTCSKKKHYRHLRRETAGLESQPSAAACQGETSPHGCFKLAAEMSRSMWVLLTASPAKTGYTKDRRLSSNRPIQGQSKQQTSCAHSSGSWLKGMDTMATDWESIYTSNSAPLLLQR